MVLLPNESSYVVGENWFVVIEKSIRKNQGIFVFILYKDYKLKSLSNDNIASILLSDSESGCTLDAIEARYVSIS